MSLFCFLGIRDGALKSELKDEIGKFREKASAKNSDDSNHYKEQDLVELSINGSIVAEGRIFKIYDDDQFICHGKEYSSSEYIHVTVSKILSDEALPTDI